MAAPNPSTLTNPATTSSTSLRIPFLDAVTHPQLLGPRWAELSLPQQVTLKVIYGCPLGDDRTDERGWSELDYWAAFEGFGEFDDFGYLTKVDREGAGAYTPQKYSEAWLCEGVRAGKSTVASFIVVYEAVCGGHETQLRPGRRAYIFQVAQDLRQSRYAIHDIEANLHAIPMLQTPYKGEPRYKALADRIDLWNGMTIMTCPPTIKSVRGYDSPVGVLDEVAVWAQDEDAANRDTEVYSQIRSRQAQFDYPLIVGITSPWNKAGLLWERMKAGTNGKNVACDAHAGVPSQGCVGCERAKRGHRGRLFFKLPTAAVANPLVKRPWLEEYRAADPRAFARECLAEPQDSVSGFLDGDALRAAVDRGVRTRPFQRGPIYVAAMDPAFRRDIFAFAIGHTGEGGKVILDYVERWKRAAGAPPLDPETVLPQIRQLCAQYQITVVGTDQYQLESIRALAAQHGLSLREINFQSESKAEVFGSFAGLLNQRKLQLLDHSEMIGELATIERKLLPSGRIQISAPAGFTDDLATVAALVAYQAVWLTPQPLPAEHYHDPIDDMTLQERIQAQIVGRHVIVSEGWD